MKNCKDCKYLEDGDCVNERNMYKNRVPKFSPLYLNANHNCKWYEKIQEDIPLHRENENENEL